MKIYLEKPITGMISINNKTTSVLDTSSLDDMKKIEIENLVKDSNFFNISQILVNLNAVDHNPYRITISSSDKEHSITIDNFLINEKKYAKLKELARKVKEYGNNSLI